ncbi:helix-turn-helix domain-containing protein [Ectobacillus funiculus]|uniref:Helix-turn-helix domain-containing protein n=1 Tax=Ectobacillus funiculus TaxID=137993 RepID=A0ABV5WPY7_9BACI
MKTIFEEIGEKITNFLEVNKMSQVEFAERLGVSKQVMSKIVNGKKATNIQEIQKIAEIMNIKVDDLIKRTSQAAVIEDPILFMMERTDNPQIRQHLQYLDFVMDQIIELDELSRQGKEELK